MRKSHRVSYEQAEVVRELMKSEKNALVYRRLQVVALLGEGMKSTEVAKITGYCEKQVRVLALNFHEKGVDFAVDHRKGGNHCNLSQEEYGDFLEGFRDQAERGEITHMNQLSEAFDKRVGKTHKSHSTLYKVIHRIGWRMVAPRPKHPQKASPEAIEASKKLSSL